MLNQFQEVWNDYLERIIMIFDRVDLSLRKARLIYNVPYPTTPEAREAKREKIDKMLAMKIMVPS